MKLKLLKIISGDILYFNAQSECVDPDGLSGVINQKKTGLLILDRQHYFETVKPFLFDNVRDIKNAVKLDLHEYSPFETDMFFIKKISDLNGKTLVNIWFLKNDSAETIKKYSPLFIVPETYLYSMGNKTDRGGMIIKKGENDYLYISSDVNGIKSQSGPDAEHAFKRFCRSTGASPLDNTVIDQAEGLKQFRNTLSLFTLRDMAAFLNPISIKTDVLKKQLYYFISFLGALFLLYNAISFYMTTSMLNKLKSEESHLSKVVDDLLLKRETIEHMLVDQDVLVSKLNEYPSKYQCMDHLDSLLDDETIIDSITIVDQEVKLTGKTVNGTAIINLLSKNSVFSRVKLLAPLRKDKQTGLDRFSVSFVFSESKRVDNER